MNKLGLILSIIKKNYKKKKEDLILVSKLTQNFVLVALESWHHLGLSVEDFITRTICNAHVKHHLIFKRVSKKKRSV